MEDTPGGHPPEYLSRKFPFCTVNMFYLMTSNVWLCQKEKRKWKFTAQIFGGVLHEGGSLNGVGAS
jgi:hypothetical protein